MIKKTPTVGLVVFGGLTQAFVVPGIEAANAL